MDLRMVEAAISSLLDNLHELLVDEIHLFSGRESDFEQLQNELELMKACFRDKGETLAQFERDIREVVYEAEDFIDAYAALIKKEKSRVRWKILTDPDLKDSHKPSSRKDWMVTRRLKILSKRRRLGKTLSVFREETLRPLLDRLQMVSAHALSATTSQHPNTQHHSHRAPLFRKDDIVGFEEEASTLMKRLLEETEELDVISIVGMHGLGKSTLAWKISHDDMIIKEFPYLIWVYASEEFNTRDAFLDILREFTKEDMYELPDALLADIVRNNLENQRFLMIIDGVHTSQDWRYFEAALPKTNRLGKVLLTTRHHRVAREAYRSREPHTLRLLNLDESWELLQLEVFGRNNNCPSELEGTGKQIALECKGLPLSLVVIGRILVEQCSHNEDLWKKVSNNVSTYLQNDQKKYMEKRISLSCNKLPSHLRDCFLYLGMFPQDAEIPAWKLTRLWIAEGFIQENPRKRLEEVAGDYLNDLVARNLVMVEKTKANGDVKTCRVHDMIREFCQSRAAVANLFQEVKMTREDVFDPAVSLIYQHRRLCIHSNVIEFLRQKPNGPRVRSFACFSKESINLPNEYTQLITEVFDLLRIVDVNPIKFLTFPPKLTKLIHLRYIALSGNEFRALPEAVSKLWNLQTIKIDTTSYQIKINADLWKMMQLRHLKTKAAIVLNEETEGIGGESLQTLSRLSPQSLTNDLCDRAFNLKNLGIRGDLNTLTDTTCLARLDHLEKLKLVHDVNHNTAPGNPLIRLPDQRVFPPNLRILELSFTYLEWKHISILETLPALEMLKLKANAFVGSSWKVDGGCFRYLEALQIEHLDLEVWTASEDSFPRLRCIVLKKCEKLKGIPHVLVKSLQVVDIEGVKESLVDSAMRIKEEVQAEPGARRGEFQLKISPGDESL